MTAAFQDILNVYLLPFVLALPLALVVLFFVWRQGDQADAPKVQPRRSTPPQAALRNVVRPQVAQKAQAPAAPVLPVPVPPAPVPPAPVTQGRAVLVVDDSAVARAKLRKLFEGAGFTVTVANDGVHALELLAQCRFNVVVTDLEMPRMDGFALIAAIQGDMDTEDLPVIAITGHEDMQARVHQVQGLYGIYKKPWNDREMLKRVATLCAMHAQGSGARQAVAS